MTESNSSHWDWVWRGGKHVQVYTFDLRCTHPGCEAHEVWESDGNDYPWYASGMGDVTLCPEHAPYNAKVAERRGDYERLEDGSLRYRAAFPTGTVRYGPISQEDWDGAAAPPNRGEETKWSPHLS